ncbi:FAD-binding oxidoreductase [Patulibacter minatonensis]|uniref:FAD-binding oxidoreductase n=1 Tax=Patulibacter minatonensis TaxID=298163 RepID=UPI000478E90C|nr:FAD-binding oxidoreductase [Patulibacter minatonensis]
MSTTLPTAHDDALLALRHRLDGTLALAGEPGYELATPWNVAVPMTPRAVVAAAGPDDVVETVRAANELGLRVAVQRTGHGAVATDGDDVVLVHTGRLDGVHVDPATRIARIGAGAVWQQVLDAAAPHGLAPLVGSAPHVGVAGFLTGGGIGPLVRTFGLSSDTVRAFDVVTGDGRLLHVTPDEHAELFWGLRGGKGTLGIVCAVELDLLPVAEIVGGALYFDGADAAAVLHAWRTWAPALPEHANTSVALLQLPPLPGVPPVLAGRLTVAVRFASVEDAGTCEALLAPMRAVATPILDAVGPIPHAAIGAVHADPVDPLPGHEDSSLLRELPAEAVDALLALAGPAVRSPQAVVELRLLGGALARPAAHTSAFCHRGAAFTLSVIGVLAPEIAAIVPGHAAEVVAALDPWSTGGRLPNFTATADPALLARCYDESTLAWLGTLAERHDPAGVLKVGQVVRG